VRLCRRHGNVRRALSLLCTSLYSTPIDIHSLRSATVSPITVLHARTDKKFAMNNPGLLQTTKLILLSKMETRSIVYQYTYRPCPRPKSTGSSQPSVSTCLARYISLRRVFHAAVLCYEIDDALESWFDAACCSDQGEEEAWRSSELTACLSFGMEVDFQSKCTKYRQVR
jgi:hypothetical protein